MLINSTDRDCYLIEVSDLSETPHHKIVLQHLQTLRTVVGWAHQYLTKPHPDSGHSGPVCPFVQDSLNLGGFYLTVFSGADFDDLDLEKRIGKYRDWFSQFSPPGGKGSIHKTILILFPEINEYTTYDIIDRTQQRLKPQYIRKGLMIGEFHPGPPRKGGVKNPSFLPLKSPVAALVLRHMVPSDFVFVKNDPDLLGIFLEYQKKSDLAFKEQ